VKEPAPFQIKRGYVLRKMAVKELIELTSGVSLFQSVFNALCQQGLGLGDKKIHGQISVNRKPINNNQLGKFFLQSSQLWSNLVYTAHQQLIPIHHQHGKKRLVLGAGGYRKPIVNQNVIRRPTGQLANFYFL